MQEEHTVCKYAGIFTYLNNEHVTVSGVETKVPINSYSLRPIYAHNHAKQRYSADHTVGQQEITAPFITFAET